MCCRPQSFNSASKNATVEPAPRFGAFSCDTPYDLALSAAQAIPVLLGVNGTSDLAFTLFTGDLVSHDPEPELSRDYVRYTETAVFSLLKQYLGDNPICRSSPRSRR